MIHITLSSQRLERAIRDEGPLNWGFSELGVYAGGGLLHPFLAVALLRVKLDSLVTGIVVLRSDYSVPLRSGPSRPTSLTKDKKKHRCRKDRNPVRNTSGFPAFHPIFSLFQPVALNETHSSEIKFWTKRRPHRGSWFASDFTHEAPFFE